MIEHLRHLPRVDTLAAHEAFASLPEAVRTHLAREAVDRLRVALLAGRACEPLDELAFNLALRWGSPPLAPVLNASGVVLHTGLGRARLAIEAIEAVQTAAQGHCALEFDVDSGTRGDRLTDARELLCLLTGAEDAHVVNNGAAAVFLALAALSEGKQVILSRGQMVEIGGSFRLPEIVVQSGCRLVEVGCTNKTRLADYEQAVTPETGAILRCHPSNFRIEGFTAEPSLGELVALAKAKGVPLIDDAGSGALLDTSRFGLHREPLLSEALSAGASVVTASGDKLLGGPQAGLLLGSREAIEKVRQHPIARAVRVDKLTVAALVATLKLYVEGRQDRIPTLRYLGKPLQEVQQGAERLAGAFTGATVEASTTEVGGGSLPGAGIVTAVASIPSRACHVLAKQLRQQGLVGRIERGRVLLDPRTLEDDEVEAACGILRAHDAR